MMTKYIKMITKNPLLLTQKIAQRIMQRCGKSIPDEMYIKRLYRMKTGKRLNLDNPKTFNEKLQWLKLYDFKPEYTQMADKYCSRACIIEKLRSYFENPEQFLASLYGVWDKFDDIDFGLLPEQFVLKTNHDSGGVVICSDKLTFDIASAKSKLSKSLKRNYYMIGREPCYRDIRPKIIAEELLGFDNSVVNSLRCAGKYTTPIDYKVHCANGIPQFIQVIGDRDFSNHTGKAAFYTPNWKRLERIFYDYPEFENDVPKPENLEQILKIASILADGIVYSRIDMYEVSGNVKCGEITFYPASGLYIYPNGKENIDMQLGGMIDLSQCGVQG